MSECTSSPWDLTEYPLSDAKTPLEFPMRSTALKHRELMPQGEGLKVQGGT